MSEPVETTELSANGEEGKVEVTFFPDGTFISTHTT